MNHNLPNELVSSPFEQYVEISKQILLESFCKSPKNKSDKRCSGGADYAKYVEKYSSGELRTSRETCSKNGYWPCKYYSQQHEDAVLYQTFFEFQKNGTYLEMGALDGLTYSNTKFFEETLGWSGTLIEASPPSFQKLKQNRPNNRLFHNAVCSERKLISFSGSNAAAGIKELMGNEHIKANQFGSAIHTVQCERLSTLLSGVESIDLWSLDVEGAEYDVLLSMDWNIPVRVIIIERNANDLAIEQLLLNKGFKYVREQRGNRVWVNPTFESKSGISKL
jgi:FkbM family methyltransferase